MNLPFLRSRPSPADLAPVPVPPAAPKPALVPVDVVSAPAAVRVGPLFAPGRYVVTYDRVGEHGDRRTGRPAPLPLTVWAMSAADLAAHIRADVEPYVGTDRAEVTIDMQVSGGKVRAGEVSGTFLFARGGAR